MKKITFEQALMMLVLSLFGCCIGLIIALAAEHHNRVQYEQAACILSDVCRFSLESDCLDLPGFEDRYYDALYNLDCHDMTIDRKFVEQLKWCYTPEQR